MNTGTQVAKEEKDHAYIIISLGLDIDRAGPLCKQYIGPFAPLIDCQKATLFCLANKQALKSISSGALMQSNTVGN